LSLLFLLLFFDHIHQHV